MVLREIGVFIGELLKWVVSSERRWYGGVETCMSDWVSLRNTYHVVFVQGFFVRTNTSE